MLNHLGFLLSLEIFIIDSLFSIEISTHLKYFSITTPSFMYHNSVSYMSSMMFESFFFISGNHHLHLYKFLSLMVITRCSKVSFSYRLSNEDTFKILIFIEELLMGETCNKDIRLAKPNLLMLLLKLLIPLRIHMLMVWFSVIHLTVVHGNE